jgi:hypothetical protein
MIGTTRSRVSFFMNKFRKLGFIDYNGGIEVHSSLLSFCATSRISRFKQCSFCRAGLWIRTPGLLMSPVDWA